jgi:hypothetical protein
VSAAFENERTRTEQRLAQTRQELVDLFTSDRAEPGPGQPARASAGSFPRSRTIRLLLGKQGLGAVAAIVAGILVARPAIAWRLLRLLPIQTFARTMFVRFLTSHGSKL